MVNHPIEKKKANVTSLINFANFRAYNIFQLIKGFLIFDISVHENS